MKNILNKISLLALMSIYANSFCNVESNIKQQTQKAKSAVGDAYESTKKKFLNFVKDKKNKNLIAGLLALNAAIYLRQSYNGINLISYIKNNRYNDFRKYNAMGATSILWTNIVTPIIGTLSAAAAYEVYQAE